MELSRRSHALIGCHECGDLISTHRSWEDDLGLTIVSIRPKGLKANFDVPCDPQLPNKFGRSVRFIPSAAETSLCVRKGKSYGKLSAYSLGLEWYIIE